MRKLIGISLISAGTIGTLICLVMLFVAGCANSERRTIITVTDPNGRVTVTDDKLSIGSVFQDFNGSELSASQKVGGEVKVKAGKVDNTISPVTTDVVKQFVEGILALKQAGLLTVPVAP